MLLALPWETFSSMAQVLVFPLTVLTTVGVVVSLAFTRRQLRYTQGQFRQSVRDSAANRRAAEQSQVEAAAAADRAESSARGTIDALDQVAKQVEAVAARLRIEIRTTTSELRADVTGSASSAALPRAEWRLSHYQGDRYQLDNFGAGNAYLVRLSADPSMLLHADELEAGTDIPAGQAATFIAARTMGTRDSTITVTWKAAPEDVADLTWRYPLPPKR